PTGHARGRGWAPPSATPTPTGGRAAHPHLDGGVKAHNIAELRSWGVTNAVVGSGLFNDRASVAENLAELTAALHA
ncbi:MAG: hypothetical protein VX891_01125, partial [Candidatus Thermoplasmatota archaeon]|nr:hypothetical protein [Candidatus Thermoplasmatota archaeon]